MQQDEKAAGSPYELYEKLSISYPSLLQPLIHERDMVYSSVTCLNFTACRKITHTQKVN